MVEIVLLGAATGTLVGLGIVEAVAHRRVLAKLPIRIHVAGTRGKSSVTRLIAAGLREGGIRTAAKTTGTLARMIIPDGREFPVFRPAGANIIEQARIASTAAAQGAEAWVVECMALQPLLHWIAESMFVRATHAVITNARPDHLEVMGPGPVDVAKALAGMVPRKAVLYTAERVHLDVFQAAADDRGTRLVAVSEEDVAAITPEDMSGFSYTEHAENVALALRVLADLGVARDVALKGMWAGRPDPGALTEHVVEFFGRRIVFVNAFAANDPQSTGLIWNIAKNRHPEVQKTVAVFNMRADRPARTAQLAGEAEFWREADDVVLIGSGAYSFARVAAQAGVDTNRFIFADHDATDQIFEQIVGACDAPLTMVIGMGNIGGPGIPLVNYFKNRALPRSA